VVLKLDVDGRGVFDCTSQRIIWSLFSEWLGLRAFKTRRESWY
jgi:hypothetical protein